jgi:hypothetical protein
VYGSLFLAFAWLYPDFNLMIYFIIPVKVKWLALLTVFLYAVSFSKGLSNLANGGWVTCLIILAGNLNLLLFFGTDFYYFLRSRQRRMTQQVKQIHASQKPRHVCVVCGANNLTHPQHDFRYCPECEGTPAYCQDHLPGHTHLGPQRAAGKMPL